MERHPRLQLVCLHLLHFSPPKCRTHNTNAPMKRTAETNKRRKKTRKNETAQKKKQQKKKRQGVSVVVKLSIQLNCGKTDKSRSPQAWLGLRRVCIVIMKYDNTYQGYETGALGSDPRLGGAHELRRLQHCRVRLVRPVPQHLKRKKRRDTKQKRNETKHKSETILFCYH